MSPKYQNLEIALIYFLILIPWPHTNVIKMLCSRDNSRLVRKIVRSKWTPILDKYQVKLPMECPLHPFRDLFAPRQDAKKRDRPTQWTCRLCGKSFYQEKFLDLHFETRHKSTINEVEDSVCLADFCDIMRCEVFQTEESSSLKFGDQHIITDIEVWGDSLGQNSALAKANAAYLSLIPLRTSMSGATRAAKVQNRQLIQDQTGQSNDESQTDSSQQSPTSEAKSKIINESFLNKLKNGVINSGGGGKGQAQTQAQEEVETKAQTENVKKAGDQQQQQQEDQQDNTTANDQTKSDGNVNNTSNNNNSSESGNNNSSLNNNNNNNNSMGGNNAQKSRANCKAEHLSKLKSRCEMLLRGCIGSLLLSMTDQNFKEMEEEMNKAVCWYLTCDRYWEDGPLEPRAFPWGLIVILIFVLSTGICFCYYIIWILFDSEETTINVNHHMSGYGMSSGGGISSNSGSGYMLWDHPQQYQSDYMMASDLGVAGGIHGPTMAQHQQQQQQQAYYYQQQQQQQQQQHELYPEPLQYDYHRHSPRHHHYIGDQRQPVQGTPTAAAAVASTAGVGLGVNVAMLQQQHSNTATPLHHQQHTLHQQQHQQRHQSNLAYQQDILDRRDYTSSRPSMTTTAAASSGRGGPSISATATSSSAAAACETSMSGVVMAATSGGRHYNTHPRPLESRRHVGSSQQSLRASSSTHEIIQNEVGQNEQYIYVTYPPDLKKRYFEKHE